MKFSIILTCIFTLLVAKVNCQNYFAVTQLSRQEFKPSIITDQGKYYRIILLPDSTVITYPLRVPKDFDTFKAIKDLLAMEGDKRLCALPIMEYNPIRSEMYLGKSRNYSIQVEALFIINQIVLKKPFLYSSCPILMNKATKRQASISGKIIREAFKKYREWLVRIMKSGEINRIEETGDMPLAGSKIQWY
jgi:hypothetical protein